MIFLLPLNLDAYHLAGYGNLCSPSSTSITSSAKCIDAAACLGLEWGGWWFGPRDFPGCLYTRDPRRKVYFNLSPHASRVANNPDYSAVCTGGGQCGHDGLVV